MSKIKQLAALLLGTSLILSGCSQTQQGLVLTGSVEGSEVIISSQVTGTVTQLLVQSGDQVNSGDVLIQLDDRDLLLQREKLEIAKQIAELQYKDLKNGASKALIRQQIASRDQLKAQLDGSNKELTYLRKQLSDVKALIGSGADAQTKAEDLTQQIERETTKYNALNQQTKAAQEALNQTLEGAVDEKLQQALLQINLKDKEIEQANLAIDKAKILSPISGVIQTVNYDIGELVMPGQKLFSVVDNSKTELKVYVAEKDLQKISIGQKVKLMPEFAINPVPTATITYIASKAEFTPKNTESKESKQEMVFEVRISISDSTKLIKPGMYIDVDLESESNE